MNILFIDTETTGQDPNTHQVIELAAEYHVDGNKVSSFSKDIGIYTSTVDLGALKYNGTKLKKITGIPGNSSTGAVMEFADYVLNIAQTATGPIYIAGHNVDFDVNFINNMLKAHGLTGLGTLVSYRKLDTSGIALFLQSVGLLDAESLSLESLADYFGVKNIVPKVESDAIDNVNNVVNGRFHTAGYDAAVTARVFYALQNHVKGVIQIKNLVTAG